MAKNSGSVYISAEGYVLPCGFLHDRFYGAESEQHTDRKKLFEMIQSAGGLDAIDIKNHDIIDIVQNSFFAEIENSWNRPDKLERCANQCGNESNLVYNANRELAKIWSGENQLKEK
jgi:MoaA/NifB/PqqE/SkfB family radical SAM enzyme